MVSLLFLVTTLIHKPVLANSVDNYLLKPTGVYKVGFQDFHWINTNICPGQCLAKEMDW